ncbi:MAG TPA: Asp-tRNA(Asn)/Glu-tRNA(Gln) amidotransferase subunit GatB [Gammaproteobacteria bacterium]|nr:Asp-tRNA(Asn)/Glu-tRNA(Gln) amidotransferase subunit GatB [Gammaproteobacteria bacterium]HRA42480.1 Asp-tRNA(Asn)/Glu-tRNA(Gln) amidotransferase subunit GatB [Gammaproteobacteria bacterium]
MKTQWETVIGLEIHVQLMTQSKLFSGAATAYGAEPNVQACAIDLGLPGVLPVLNTAAVRMAIKFGLSIGSTIASRSIFARKNYFYPDLPKGYQISQFELPIVSGGSVEFTLPDGTPKKINITRAHLEEDAGKSLHEDFHGYTGIDLNRAGIPLIEIVSEPEMRSATEAVAYLKTIHALVRYLEISDGNMQEGSFRCDANVSVRPLGQEKFGTRAEIKNVNSFRFVEKAINYEVKRQIELLENGGTVIQETRLYDANKDETRSMRAKEEANDYRYFPDPDLLPVIVDQTLIDEIRKTLPELPREKATRFEKVYALSNYDAIVLTSSRELADFFEATVHTAKNSEAKLCANWIMGELLAALNKADLELTESPVSPEKLGRLVERITDKTISGKIAKVIFEEMWNTQKDVDLIIEEKSLKQVTDTAAIEVMIDAVIAANPTQVADYKSGKAQLFGFFVGQVMKASQGKANPDQVNEILKGKL